MYYTYAYLREDGTPYYIGKGCGNRAYNTHKRKNGECIRPKNKNQILILKKFENEKNAYLHEEYMISIFKRKCDGGILINILSGKYDIQYSNSKYKTNEERIEYRKESIRKAAKKYRKNHKNKVNQKNREIHQLNKEVINEKRRQRYNPLKKKEKYKQLKDNENYQLYKENINEKQRQRYQLNKELISEKQRQRYQLNKELISEKRRQRHQLNKEVINEKRRQRHQLNKELISEKRRQRYKLLKGIDKSSL